MEIVRAIRSGEVSFKIFPESEFGILGRVLRCLFLLLLGDIGSGLDVEVRWRQWVALGCRYQIIKSLVAAVETLVRPLDVGDHLLAIGSIQRAGSLISSRSSEVKQRRRHFRGILFGSERRSQERIHLAVIANEL